MGKGSLVLKIVIVLLIFLLVVVIAVPEKIWTEEEMITYQSRRNMTSIYEAEQFFFRKTGEFTTNLDTLVTVIQNDSSLLQRKQQANLTNEIYQVLGNTLDIPSLQSILVVSKSVREIQGDIVANDRYFEKYEELNRTKDEIYMNLNRFDSSAAFPSFCSTKSFVDSVDELKNRINEYRLQNAAYHAQNYLDSIRTFLPGIEKSAVREFWGDLNNRMDKFIKDADNTDIKRVSNIVDRLKRFKDRVNASIQIFLNSNTQADLNELSNQGSTLSNVYQSFISPENFQLTQRYGLLELTEVDSTLLSFGPENFTGPDSKEEYVIDEKPGSILIESPNLLTEFANKNREIVQDIKDNNLFNQFSSLKQTLDSTEHLMNQQIPLIRRHGNILLSIKEIIAEMKNLNSVKSYSMIENLQFLVDTVQTEKKISALEPIFVETLTPMDSLADRIRSRNIKDLEEKLQYLGNKIQDLDSTIMSMRLPSRIQNQIRPFYPAYEPVFSILKDLKGAMNEELADRIETAANKLEKSMNQVKNGYNERVYVIFNKKHINHGYIKNGVKSWEEE
jgi:translation initiation factor 2B subunit (eIF-2B alpha/beta/delta family)